MSMIWLATAFTAPRMRESVPPASSAAAPLERISAAPSPTAWTEASGPRCTPSISAAISFVADETRSASWRTSSATTANPRPCSPARAASMAALRARRFVCAAMSSMTATIFPISCDSLDVDPVDLARQFEHDQLTLFVVRRDV